MGVSAGATSPGPRVWPSVLARRALAAGCQSGRQARHGDRRRRPDDPRDDVNAATAVPRARRTPFCARQVIPDDVDNDRSLVPPAMTSGAVHESTSTPSGIASRNRNLLLHERVRAIRAAMHEAAGQEQGTRNGVDWRGNRRIDVRTTFSDRCIHGNCPNRHSRWETMNPLQTTETSALLRKPPQANPAIDRSPGCRTKPPPPRRNRRSGGQTFRPVADQ